MNRFISFISLSCSIKFVSSKGFYNIFVCDHPCRSIYIRFLFLVRHNVWLYDYISYNWNIFILLFHFNVVPFVITVLELIFSTAFISRNRLLLLFTSLYSWTTSLIFSVLSNLTALIFSHAKISLYSPSSLLLYLAITS